MALGGPRRPGAAPLPPPPPQRRMGARGERGHGGGRRGGGAGDASRCPLLRKRHPASRQGHAAYDATAPLAPGARWRHPAARRGEREGAGRAAQAPPPRAGGRKESRKGEGAGCMQIQFCIRGRAPCVMRHQTEGLICISPPTDARCHRWRRCARVLMYANEPWAGLCDVMWRYIEEAGQGPPWAGSSQNDAFSVTPPFLQALARR